MPDYERVRTCSPNIPKCMYERAAETNMYIEGSKLIVRGVLHSSEAYEIILTSLSVSSGKRRRAGRFERNHWRTSWKWCRTMKEYVLVLRISPNVCMNVPKLIVRGVLHSSEAYEIILTSLSVSSGKRRRIMLSIWLAASKGITGGLPESDAGLWKSTYLFSEYPQM